MFNMGHNLYYATREYDSFGVNDTYGYSYRQDVAAAKEVPKCGPSVVHRVMVEKTGLRVIGSNQGRTPLKTRGLWWARGAMTEENRIIDRDLQKHTRGGCGP